MTDAQTVSKKSNMCVKKCECNTCLKKYTCSDCYYIGFKKDVDCSNDGVQGCEHYQYYYDIIKDYKKEQINV